MTESGHGLAGHPTVVAVSVSGKEKPPVVRPGRGPVARSGSQRFLSLSVWLGTGGLCVRLVICKVGMMDKCMGLQEVCGRVCATPLTGPGHCAGHTSRQARLLPGAQKVAGLPGGRWTQGQGVLPGRHA